MKFNKNVQIYVFKNKHNDKWNFSYYVTGNKEN